MEICGLQKVTLLDFPGVVACTVFTGGCNFRCPFCHNASLVLPEEIPDGMSREEIFAFLRKRKGVLDGVAITGGEPLLWPDTIGFIRSVREMGYKVKLDSNGSFPERLREILEEELVDRVAMDIKNSPEKYGQTIGVPNFDLSPVRESVDLLKQSKIEYEFRTTVVKPIHTKKDFEQIGRWIEGASEYYLQGFTDSGELIAGQGLGAYSKEEMEEFTDIVKAYVPHTYIRGVE